MGEIAVDAALRTRPGGAGRRGLHRRPLRPPAAAGAADRGAPPGADRQRPLGSGAARGPHSLLPLLGESEAGPDRRDLDLLAGGAGGGDAGRARRSRRRHALSRLRGGLEAEAGDAAGRACVRRERRRAQARLPHGEGGAGRSRAGAAAGEEGAGRSRGGGGDRSRPPVTRSSSRAPISTSSSPAECRPGRRARRGPAAAGFGPRPGRARRSSRGWRARSRSDPRARA